MNEKIVYETAMTPQLYRRLCNFNVYHKSRWTIPMLALILLASLLGLARSIYLTGSLWHLSHLPFLLAIAFMLLVMGFAHWQVEKVIREDPTMGRYTYVYTFSPKGLDFSCPEQFSKGHHKWDELQQAYFLRDSVFFYLNSRSVILLPDDTLKEGTREELYQLAVEKMGAKQVVKRC
ncbi:MAG: hypothetical protein ACOX7F_05520 [Eubacteriales bacterium]